MTAAVILPSLGLVPEIAVAAIPGDERVWVPQAADVWFRPLLLNTVSGGWCNLLRVRRSGVLSRHRHPMVVVGYVIKGRAELTVEGQTVTLGPGDSWVVPRGAEHTYRILETFTAVEATHPPAHVHGRDTKTG